MTMNDSKSEYQTIFIVYSSKRPQIMYKSVEKQITWQDMGPVLRLVYALAHTLASSKAVCQANSAL